MKRKKIWLRWIAWILFLVLCMNSAGTTALAVSANDESILNINGSLEKEMLSEEFISEEESTSSAEETPKEEITPPSEETPGEELNQNAKATTREKLKPAE